MINLALHLQIWGNIRNPLDHGELLIYPAVIISVRGYEKDVTGVEEDDLRLDSCPDKCLYIFLSFSGS